MAVHKSRCGSYDPETGLECTHPRGHGRGSSGKADGLGWEHGIQNTGPDWGGPVPWKPFDMQDPVMPTSRRTP